MKNSLWQLSKNHLLAIGIFFIISCIYCAPALKGLVLNQHDSNSWRQMAQQSLEFKEKHGHFPLWTNSLFSGMPAFQIAMESKHNVTIAQLNRLFTLFLPGPAGLFFLCCIGFYILCVVLRMRTWIGILASLAYAYASYSAVIVAVGHNTKFAAMGYAPAVLAGLLLLTQRKYVAGFATTLLFTTLMTWQNHVQVSYYTFIVAACMGVAWVIHSIRETGAVKHIVSTLVLAVVAVAISVASYSVVLMPTIEFAKETMRGGRSELTDSTASKENKTKGGLDKDYAFMWSYGKTETFTFAVPRVYGGSDDPSELGTNSKSAQTLSRIANMDEEQANQFVQGFPLSPYWGDQPSTSGPVYFGAVICFLFILALVMYRGWHLGWIISASIIGIVLAWGKNLPGINYWLFDHLPFYNKFRAPTISLVIPQLTFPLLAALGLNQLVTEKELGKNIKELWKKFKIAGAITGVLIIVLAGLYFSLDYKGSNDPRLREALVQQMLGGARGQQPSQEQMQQANDFGRSMINSLDDDRRSMFGGDLVRTIIFMILAAAVVALYLNDKIKTLPVLISLTILSFIDLMGVDIRYLTYRNYREAEDFEAFIPTAADQQIKQDTGYYRVYDALSRDPYQDARASYFHNSVGGYNPAKLALYDDLLKRQLSRGNMQVFNMLNTKYFIMPDRQTGQQPVVQQNPFALGAAWLVKSLQYVNNADEEMKALDNLNTKDTAVLDKREQPKVTLQPQYDSTATIKLVENLNDQIKYDFNGATNQFAVFSEIYYPLGWKAFIDGKETPIVKVDYLLRGLPVPAGKHSIEFRFEPQSFKTGDNITLIAGIISILALLFAIGYEWKAFRKNHPATSA